MTSPFGSSDPFDDPFFKKDHFGTDAAIGSANIDKTANRIIKGVGCFAIVYVISFVLFFAGLIALIWKLVFA